MNPANSASLARIGSHGLAFLRDQRSGVRNEAGLLVPLAFILLAVIAAIFLR